MTRLLVCLMGVSAAATSVLVPAATADTTPPAGFPDVVIRASVVADPAQSNVAPGGTLSGLREGSVVHIDYSITGGQVFDVTGRVCRTGLAISDHAGFSPTTFGNCIPSAFAPGTASGDDATAHGPSASPNTSGSFDIRVGRGTKTFSSASGFAPITCDALHQCALWLEASVPFGAGSDGLQYIYKHFELTYARETIPTSDYDEDAKADVSVFRPSSATWHTHPSLGTPDQALVYGAPGDVAVPADYDGDLKADTAVFTGGTSGTWSTHKSGGGDTSFVFGDKPGDTPVPADYDGDGKADIAIFRPALGDWYVHRSSDSTDTALNYGATGDVPVPGDYDGDGKADVAVFRASIGLWAVHKSAGGDMFVTFGVSGDIPTPGDYDHDGKTDLAVYRGNGDWFVHPSSGGADTRLAYGGLAGDVPVATDYDADGKTDIAIFRPSAGLWAVHKTTGSDTFFTFGVAGDSPLPLPEAIRRAYF